MIPIQLRKSMHKSVELHVGLCEFIKVPDYQIRREIDILLTGIMIGSGIKPDERSRRFVSLMAGRYAPKKLIVPADKRSVHNGPKH